ncbi:MAG: Rib/alpha-like domain-containing protein [Anaerococcus obesiensis]
MKNKIKDINKNNFPENTQVEVDEKGNVSVTYPDKSKDMIESGKLVFQESKGAATEIEKPEMPISEIINPLLPKNKIKVNNLEKLTEKEKEEIKNKIKDINKNNFPKNTQVEVDEKGNVTITYPDNSKDTINASDLVEKMAQAQNNKTDAQNNPAVIPAKTLVKDKNNLTDKEKAEIASKVKKSNPKAINIEVTKNGSVTITYPDGSKNMIDGSKLVSEKAKEITSNSKKQNLHQLIINQKMLKLE